MSKIKWKLEKRRISDLIPYHKNPRQLTKDQEAHLRTSLDKFGLIDRPCINKDNTIIGGHQRLAMLRKEEVQEIEVWVPSRVLKEDEIEELNIRLNKNLGEWDWDMLANEFSMKDLMDWGFSENEILGSSDDIPSGEDDNEQTVGNKCPHCGKKMKKKITK